MTVRVRGTTIILTQGDTAHFQLDLTDWDGNKYTPRDSDMITFTLSRSNRDYGIFTKRIMPSDMILELLPEETKKLRPGRYRYYLSLTTENGFKDTFINGHDLFIERGIK